MKALNEKRKHILLADDDESVRDITRMLLERYGHRVTATDCGVEALRIFSLDPGYFDVVILDQEMPDLKGTDVTSRLMSLCSTMPIVLYTGCLDADLTEKARKAGIQEVVSKPFSIGLLMELINRNANGARVSRRRAGRRMECGWLV